MRKAKREENVTAERDMVASTDLTLTIQGSEYQRFYSFLDLIYTVNWEIDHL